MNRTKIFWFTGLSGSGKSTVAQGTKSLLERQGYKVLILDGDEIRQKLHTHYDFSPESIKKNNEAIASLCIDQGQFYDIIFVAVISPYKESRRNARFLLGENFYEVYFCVDLETVVRRDTKGLYAKAKANEIKNMVGFSPGAIYEPPQNPDFIIDSAKEDVAQSTDRFFHFIISKIKLSEGKDFSSTFLREYVDMIGALSVANKSRLWWATDIASKNRFNSNLAPLLQEVLEGASCTKQPSFKDWTHACRKFFVVFYHAFIFIGRICYAKCQLRVAIGTRLSSKQAYYVIKTFIYDHSFAKDGTYADSFLGSLPQTLKQKQPVLILGQVLGDYKQCIHKIRQCRDFVIVPVEYFVSLCDVLSAIKDILLFKPCVPKDLKFFEYSIADVISTELFRTYKGVQIYQLLHYASTVRLLKAVKASTFLLTHENNPWEKMCIMALREHSPRTKILGYQHTVVPQASVNMFTSRFEQDIIPKPDVVITVGEKPKEIIHHYETCRPSAIEVGCGLRFEYLFGQPQSPRTKRGNVLLALEGLPQVVEMTNYVLNEFVGCDQYRLKIRTHPVFPLQKFIRQLSMNPRQMPGVEISQGGALSDDLAWADIVIYWGSTVALEALSMGKPVVHFDNGSLLSYDPLFELNDFKWRLQPPARLRGVLDAISLLPDGEYASRCQGALQYIADYFHPITPQNMGRFLG